MTGGGDARGAVDVEAHVVVADELGRAGVQAHAHPQGCPLGPGMRGQGAGGLGGGGTA